MEDFTRYDYDRYDPATGLALPVASELAPPVEVYPPIDDPSTRFQRAILHLDLDSFFISVERLRDASLNGRPLIVGGRSGRGVVASCSYEARAFGVRSAMPMRMALKLCPEALVIRGDMESYSKYSRLVTDVIGDTAPLYEKSSIDEFYCDLTGMDKYVGCWKWSVELRERIMRETGLPISFGLSVNKLVSKVGTNEAKPNGTLMVRNGVERDFLAPLSANKLPGLGKETCHRLSFMGVRTVRLLREIPVRLLEREFGRTGRNISRKANAIDDTPVVPHSERKSISKEKTFQQDTTNVNFLGDILTDMVTRLAFDLRQRGQLASCLTVKIRYTDFQTHTKQRHISYTANDRHFLRHARELFARLHTRRQLVRLVGVRFSGLVRGHYQVDLFEDTQRDVNLMGALDDIRARFGEHAITLARCRGRDGLRPGGDGPRFAGPQHDGQRLGHKMTLPLNKRDETRHGGDGPRFAGPQHDGQRLGHKMTLPLNKRDETRHGSDEPHFAGPQRDGQRLRHSVTLPLNRHPRPKHDGLLDKTVGVPLHERGSTQKHVEENRSH